MRNLNFKMYFHLYFVNIRQKPQIRAKGAFKYKYALRGGERG